MALVVTDLMRLFTDLVSLILGAPVIRGLVLLIVPDIVLALIEVAG